MNYELIEKEMLELLIKQEQEYHDYIKLNAYKARALELVLEEIESSRKRINEILVSYCGADSFQSWFYYEQKTYIIISLLINLGGKMEGISLEQIKAQEIVEILSDIIQKSIIQSKNKGECENE